MAFIVHNAVRSGAQRRPRGALRDAMMITAARNVEHDEIATYGTVRTYGRKAG